MYEMQNKFALCETCVGRQGGGGEENRQRFSLVRPKDCFICRGLTSKIETLSRKILRSLGSKYEFSTFSLGVILPSGVQEREDRVRSELKMRGRETIKSEISRELSGYIIKATRKKVDKLRPDLTALIDVGSLSVELSTKPLFIHGRYTKPAGIAQRRSFCDQCSGRGCDVCGNTGYGREPSVESTLASRLESLMGSTRVKFTWFGSEDVESKVLSPSGRPFVAELKSPRKRTPPRQFTLRSGKGQVKVSNLKALPGRPTRIPSFVFTTIAKIESPQRISDENLRRLRREMRMARVQFQTSKGRLVYKTVYSVSAKAVRDGSMIALIKMDGGLPVKKLVSGDGVSPSISELLNAPLRCKTFDIAKVWEVGGFGF